MAQRPNLFSKLLKACRPRRNGIVPVSCKARGLLHTSSIRPNKQLLTEASSRSQTSQASYWLLGLAATGAIGYTAGKWIHQKDTQRHPLKPQYASRSEMNIAVKEIQKILGEDGISTDDGILLAHGYSEWSSINIDTLPVAVAFPSSTEDVSRIAKICSKYKVPIIPYSGGSSVEGHFSAPFGGVSIDFMNMNNIIRFNKDDMDITVQPSLPWSELNRKIKDSGLFFPIDPGPSAQIGGMIGTGCSGTNAVKYGTMRDWVINLTVVLADGSIVKTRRRPRKSSAGYNLNGIFVGSEGTLGMVTEATLKLAVVPEKTAVAVVTFPTMRKAAEAAMGVIHRGIPVGALELLDDVQMGVINRSGATQRKWNESPTLFLKFSGTQAGISDNINSVHRVVKEHGGSEFEFAHDEKDQEELWSARKSALWSMLALRDEEGHGVWSTDVAVPLSQVPDIIEMSKTDLQNLGLFGSMLGHIGDGNFHETILFNGEEERKKVEKCVDDMVQRAIDMQGTCTGEHGIGIGKKAFLREEVGPATIDVMRSVKTSLDPQWIMNPGKVFDA